MWPPARPSWPAPRRSAWRRLRTRQDNRAVATTEQDGARVFDFAWSLDRQRGGVVDHSNVANAAARCTDCRATAIAFQIVLASRRRQAGRRTTRRSRSTTSARTASSTPARGSSSASSPATAAVHRRGPLDAGRRAQRPARARGPGSRRRCSDGGGGGAGGPRPAGADRRGRHDERRRSKYSAQRQQPGQRRLARRGAGMATEHWPRRRAVARTHGPPAPRRRRRAARRVRGLRLRGPAAPRPPLRRPGHPAHRTAAPRRRGRRRRARRGADRRRRVRALRPPRQRRQHPLPRREEAAPARGARGGGRLEPAVAQGRPAARTEVPHRARPGTGRAAPGARLRLAVLASGPRPGPRRARRLRRLAALRARGRRQPALGALRAGHHARAVRGGDRGDRLARDRPRHRLPLRRREARRPRRRHLPRLAGLLLRRHRRLPAEPPRPAAHGPRRRVLQRAVLGGGRRRVSRSPDSSRSCW